MIITGNASLIVSILGIGTGEHQNAASLKSEISRRRFWALHLMKCHAAEPAIGEEPSEKTRRLPLPWPEEDFETGHLSSPLATLEFESPSGSLYAEMTRSLTLW